MPETIPAPKNRNTLSKKILLYFAGVSAGILAAIWILQVAILPLTYDKMKLSSIAKMGREIAEAYGSPNFRNVVDRLTLKNSAYAIVYSWSWPGGIEYTSDGFGNSLGASVANPPHPDEFVAFASMLMESEYDEISYEKQGKMLVYGRRFNEGFVYIQTSLESLNATTGILSRELMIVTLLALTLSLLLSYVLSRRLSRPIARISEQAAKLSRGEYEPLEAEGFCTELDELTLTLNRAARELAVTENLRRDLLANVSHDLRTPLTLIKAYAELILDISGDNAQKREANLKVIINESDQLDSLVNDILDFSVLQSGSVKIELEVMDMSQKVASVINQFAPFCEKEGYTLTMDVAEGVSVHADAATITRVLYNLIANALNYAGADRAIEVKLIDRGEVARFQVSDHGSGIQPEEIPLIWERYYRAKTRRAKVGTGLGLSIVKEILEQHKADYGVESVVGEGSTFWFELKVMT